MSTTLMLLLLLVGVVSHHVRAATWMTERDACTPRSNYMEVDYLVVGAGIGGGQTLDDISKAVRASVRPGQKSKDTFAILERNDYIGGNFQDVEVKQPPGYPTDPLTQPPLRAPLGGARVNLLTMINQRRVLAEHGLTVYYTPWRNRQTARGRDLLCKAPRPGETFAEFRSYNDMFSKQAFVGLDSTDDPSFDAYCYLTHTSEFPCDYGAHPIPRHPLRQKECNTLLNGKSNTGENADVDLLCPREACKLYPDWKSFIAKYFSPEYQQFLAADNVGFFGDSEDSHDACAYLEYVIREWNTASVIGYPVGGMSEVPRRAITKAQTRGAQLFLKQNVGCIKRNATNSKFYEVHTQDRTFLVKKFLFLNMPPTDMRNNDTLFGDIVRDIRSFPELHFPREQKVITVAFQYPPNSAAWFFDFLDKRNGNYSYRAYGDRGCFSRLEMIDVPYFRFAGLFRPVYSDFQCRQLWEDLILKGQAGLATHPDPVDAYAELIARIHQDLKELFPNAGNIPAPIWVGPKIWDHAWHWGAGAKNAPVGMSVQRVYDWAVAPLGTGENLCLVADGYNLKYSGWGESALLSSRNCLTTRFGVGSSRLAVAVRDLYKARDKIIANKFDTLTKCPSPLKNELCGPFGPYNADGTLVGGSFCVGSRGGANPKCRNF